MQYSIGYRAPSGSTCSQMCVRPLATLLTPVLMKRFMAFCCPTWGFTSLSLPSLDVIAMAGLGALLQYHAKTCGNFLHYALSWLMQTKAEAFPGVRNQQFVLVQQWWPMDKKKTMSLRIHCAKQFWIKTCYRGFSGIRWFRNVVTHVSLRGGNGVQMLNWLSEHTKLSLSSWVRL